MIGGVKNMWIVRGGLLWRKSRKNLLVPVAFALFVRVYRVSTVSTCLRSVHYNVFLSCKDLLSLYNLFWLYKIWSQNKPSQSGPYSAFKTRGLMFPKLITVFPWPWCKSNPPGDSINLSKNPALWWGAPREGERKVFFGFFGVKIKKFKKPPQERGGNKITFRIYIFLKESKGRKLGFFKRERSPLFPQEILHFPR